MRVLVIEDDLLSADNLCALVKQSGHVVVGVVGDAASAVSRLETAGVDLALLDLKLADGVSGFRVAASAVRMGVPFLIITANLGLLFEGSAGAVGVISKPYDDATIVAALGFLNCALSGTPVTRRPRGLIMSLEWIDKLELRGRVKSGDDEGSSASWPGLLAADDERASCRQASLAC